MMDQQQQPLASGDKPTSSSTKGADSHSSSLLGRMWDGLTVLLLSLQNKEPIHDWRLVVGMALFHLYMMISSMFIPTITMDDTIGSVIINNNNTSFSNIQTIDEPYYKWGFYGGWIFNVLNYGTSLSLDRLPYIGMVVLGFICIGFLVLCIVMMIIAYRYMLLSNSFYGKIKVLVQMVLGITMVMALVMTFVMTSFMDCWYDLQNSNNSIHYLIRFGRNVVSCYSYENIIYLVFNIIGCLLLFCILPIAMLILPNTHALSKGLFIAKNSYMQIGFWTFTCIELFLVSFIPVSLGFVRGIIHIMVGMMLLYLYFQSLPYSRFIENSIMFGVICGKCGASVGALISSLVNNSNEWTLGLGMTMMTISIIVLCFIIGFVLMFVYQHLVVKRVRKVLLEVVLEKDNSLEKSCFMVFQEFEDKKEIRTLDFFLRSSTFSKTVSNDYSDLELSLCFVKGLVFNKSFCNIDILVTASILMTYFIEGEGNGIRILNHALKNHPNFYQKLNIERISIEIENFVDYENSRNKKNMLELRKVLEKLERYHTDLNFLHRHFFKELMSDAISYSKIEQINRKIASMTENCQVMYENLMQSNGNVKKLLRLYGYFLENFVFDKESSQQLLTEALSIEDEEQNRRRRGSKVQKTNKIAPLKDIKESKDHSHGSGQDLISSNEFSLAKAETVTLSGFAKNVYNSSDNLDIPLDGVENNAAAKKELLFRSALSLPEPHRLQKLGLGLFLFVTASLVLASIVLSVVLSQFATKDIIISRESCRPLGASSLLLGELRTTQALLEVFGRNDSQSVQGFQFHKTRLAAYSQSLQALIDQEKSSSNNIRNYVNGKYEMLIPALDAEGSISSTPLFTTSTIQNATVFDIVHMIMKHEQIIFNYGMDDYNKTLESFSVMFLMLNRDRAENAFQSYCLQSVSDIKVSAGKYANAYLIFYSCSVFIYLVIGFIIVGVARYQCSNSNQLIKLLELYISKNIIGKIYHYLGKRGESDEYAARSNNSTIRPSTMVVGYGFALIFCTVICLSLLCAGTITISNYAASTIQSLSRITKTLLLLQKVQSRLAELFLFNKMDGSSALNDPKLAKLTNFSTMYSEIHPLIQDLQQTWNTELSDLSKLPSYNQYISSLTGTSQCNNTGNPKACDGLNNGITNFVMNSDQLSELLQSDSYISSSKEVFKNYLDSFLTATDTTNLLLDFLEYFIYLTAKPDMVIIIVFSIFGILETLIFGYFLYSSCNSHWRDVHQLRLMLNYIPWEILDANEKLRNYVLHYDLSNGKGFLGRSKMKDDGSGGDEETRVSNILNSAVDGVILCNEKGEIDLFNPSAQKMFGIKSSDAKGIGVFTLFDQEAVGKVKSIIDIMCKNLALDDANEKKNSDSIDIDCFRKNQTKFPARINFFATLFGNNPVVTFFVKDITSEKKQQTLLEEEKKKSESLLLNILPEAVALRLKSGETYIAEKFTDVTVFFSDLVGFTKLSSNMEPIDLVKMLSVVVNEFDTLTDKYGLEKIKTIGDAYFCVGGHNNPQSDHPERALRFAIDAMTVIHNYNVEQIKEIHNNPELKRRLFADAKEGEDMSLENKQLNIRMGMNTGGVVAGVIGTKKFAYDLWGDTINMASRMESTSLPGRVHMSRATYERVHDIGFDFEERRVEVKGKGVCQTYLLNNEHHQSSVLTIEEIEQLLGGQMKAIIEEVTDPFANIDLFRSDNYSFPKLVTNAEFVAAMKEFLTDFKTDIAEFYLTLINQFKSNANVSERYEVASTLVTTFLAEEAPRRLKFKFMKNAFGPFQLKFNQCNSSCCPVDLFDNFSNLSIKTLKPEFPKFLKSNPFLTFLKKLKKQDPDTLFKYLRVGKDGSSTHDSAEEEDEKEFILFCEKCGTEIINLENHRFNDWEFDHRIEGMTTFADWRIHTETPEGKTYLSPEVDHNHLSNSRRHTQIKYHYTMDCSAEALFNLWLDPDYFKCRELTIESSNLIDFVKVGKYAHAIYHEILKMSFPQQDRELLHAYCCRKDPEQKRFLCVSRSINNPKVSEGSTYVRAEIKSAFMVEETDENKCTYTYTIIYDPMGWLNADHYFTTFKESNKDVFHDELKKMVKERGAKKSHKPPEVGGLVDSLRYSIEMRSKKP